jgi:prepilin-type processing-associated H-X9-DG protein
MNGYLREKEAIPPNLPQPVAEAMAKEQDGLIRDLYDLPETHSTIMMFEGVAVRLGTYFDHVHSYAWFSEQNLANNQSDQAVWNAVRSEVAVERHSGTVANYLYADGHVAAIAADQIAEWCQQGFNFARPPQD